MPRSLTNHIDSAEKVGQRLRESRERIQLSQRQLAFKGCTAAYISRLEKGARVPSLQMIHELARRLHVSPHWLALGPDGAAAANGGSPELEAAYARIRALEERLREIRTLADE